MVRSLAGFPGEILREILIYSLEWNLARTSKIIEEKVTGEIIYQIFIFQAFWTHPSRWIKNVPVKNLPYWYRLLSAKEQQRLQISITYTTWFNISRLHSMIPVFYNATYNAAIGHEVYVPSPYRPSTNPAMNYWAGNTHYEALNLHKIPKILVCHLPEDVLCKPWNETKLELLIILYRNLYQLPVQRSIRPLLPRKAYLLAIQDALEAGDYYPLFYLLLILKATDRSTHFADPEPVLPASLYRTALAQSKHDGKFLYLLIQVSPHSLPHDRYIYKWAVRRVPHNATARRVLETLESNRKHYLLLAVKRSLRIIFRGTKSWKDAFKLRKLVQHCIS